MALDALLHQPAWLASLGGALAAWILAVVGTAMSTAEAFAYWAIAFSLLILAAHAYCVISGYLFRSRVALCAMNAVSIVYTSRYGDAMLFGATASDKAAGAGFILLTIISIFWVVALGIDGSPFVVPGRRVAAAGKGASIRSSAGQTASRVMPMQMTGSGGAAHPPSSSSFGSVTGAAALASTQQQRPSSPQQQQQPVTVVVDQRNIPADGAGTVQVDKEVEYKHKGTALYAYSASPDDPNELSFAKGEQLEFVDVSGKWWQARKQDGSIGIVPSNYIKLAE
jgi:SHO1 osmosensor